MQGVKQTRNSYNAKERAYVNAIQAEQRKAGYAPFAHVAVDLDNKFATATDGQGYSFYIRLRPKSVAPAREWRAAGFPRKTVNPKPQFEAWCSVCMGGGKMLKRGTLKECERECTSHMNAFGHHCFILNLANNPKIGIKAVSNDIDNDLYSVMLWQTVKGDYGLDGSDYFEVATVWAKSETDAIKKVQRKFAKSHMPMPTRDMQAIRVKTTQDIKKDRELAKEMERVNYVASRLPERFKKNGIDEDLHKLLREVKESLYGLPIDQLEPEQWDLVKRFGGYFENDNGYIKLKPIAKKLLAVAPNPLRNPLGISGGLYDFVIQDETGDMTDIQDINLPRAATPTDIMAAIARSYPNMIISKIKVHRSMIHGKPYERIALLDKAGHSIGWYLVTAPVANPYGRSSHIERTSASVRFNPSDDNDEYAINTASGDLVYEFGGVSVGNQVLRNREINEVGKLIQRILNEDELFLAGYETTPRDHALFNKYPEIFRATTLYGHGGVTLAKRRKNPRNTAAANPRKRKLTEKEILGELIDDGIDINTDDVYTLRHSQLVFLNDLAKRAGYRKSQSSGSSTGAAFFRYLQKKVAANPRDPYTLKQLADYAKGWKNLSLEHFVHTFQALPPHPVKRITKETAKKVYNLLNGKTRNDYDAIDFFDDKVDEISATFTGEISGKSMKVAAPDGTPKKVSRLGHLRLIKIKQADGREFDLKFADDDDAWLVADRRKNLYFVGKDANAKGVIKLPKAGHMTDLGDVTQIDYFTTKRHIESAKPTYFYHELGEVDGEHPTVSVDSDGFLRLFGGNYDIWTCGIVN